jgi:transposase-like protein
MLWPRTPVERVQLFRPSFCPWPACSEHHRRTTGYRFRHHGFYSTRRRVVPRFLCLACRHTFSRQTFSTSYYLKRPELLLPVAAALQAGAALRQVARSLACAHSTPARLAARLGRHALLLHARALSFLRGRLAEPVVLDHFETFEFSQDLPFGVATPVGSRSWFVYGLDPAPHARTGHRTEAQVRRLRSLPRRAAFGGYHGSTRRVLAALLPLVPEGRRLHLVGDGHPAYDAAAHLNRRVRLHRFTNPKRGPRGSPRSPEARARDRAMFPSDLLHALMRHTLAHHRRETIAFGRRLNALLERLALMAVWRNFVKRRSERRPEPVTPAMRVGLASEVWDWRRVLSRRLFPGRESLSAVTARLYRREWMTPIYPRNTRHLLKQAY